MIAALVLIASASPGDFLGDDLAPAWVTADAVPLDVTRDGCVQSPRDEPPLPVGLPVQARLGYSETCGTTVAYVRTGLELGPRRSENFHLAAAALSPEPPRRNAWGGAHPVRSAWIFAPNPGYVLGSSLDPQRPEPEVLVGGLPVDVLVEGSSVVRTPWGTEVAVTPWLLRDEDPLASERSEERRTARRRIIAGWTPHASAPITPLPPADEVLVDRTLREGRTFLVEIRREHLTADRGYTAEWLDPVGQRLDNTCDRPSGWRDLDPCGAYWLDFSPFGAWWVTDSSVDLLVVSDGVETRDGTRLPRLKVVARDPFGSHPKVSPAWDGLDPGTLP